MGRERAEKAHITLGEEQKREVKKNCKGGTEERGLEGHKMGK